MTGELRYEEPQPTTRDELTAAIDAGGSRRIVEALLGLTYHDGDPAWLQETCLGLLDHDEPDVRGMAALCLGHIATFHHELDLPVVVPALLAFRDDPKVGWRADDALDDIDGVFGIRTRGGPLLRAWYRLSRTGVQW